ncbi:MAG: CO dehydrogenase/acetyl-CoA synthase complex subunit epsilon [Promethearchaeati archaeon SRVP18_Atabeyarchaeia-1]
MSNRTMPWQTANVPGPKFAMDLKGEVAGKMIQKAKRPLLIVGMNSVKDEVAGRKLIEYAIEMGKAGVKIVATAHMVKEFSNRGYKVDADMPVVNITDRLKDPEWKGIDGRGPYDIAVFLGVPYYFESQMLSTLKNFAPGLNTVAIDAQFQPNAKWSFPNLKGKDYEEELASMMAALREKKSA